MTLTVFALLSLVGWALLAMGLLIARSRRNREARERARATGTIVEYARAERAGGQVSRALPVVSFMAEERAYRLQCAERLDPEAFPVGQTVEVLYDADNPERFHLDVESAEAASGRRMTRLGLAWIACAAAIALALTAILGQDFDLRGFLFSRQPKDQTLVKSDFSYVPVGEIYARITDYNGDESSLTIPTMLDGRLVTELGNSAFSVNQSIKRVTVHGLIYTVSPGAFAGCLRLTEVTLKEGVDSIGMRAFAGCLMLQDVTLPESLVFISADAFPENCGATFHVVEGSEAERFCRENTPCAMTSPDSWAANTPSTSRRRPPTRCATTSST